MTTLLGIGEFAALTHLTVKTLRNYHEAGLLVPGHVDPHSGYRSYRPDQIPEAQVIRRFRDLDMPVREIAQVLATPDPQARAEVIATHLDRLERRLAETGQAVTALRRLLAPGGPPVEVVFRREPERTVTAVGADVRHDEVLDWYAAAMARIDAALAAAGEAPTGPPGGLYDDALFTAGAGHAVVYVPTAGPVQAGDVGPHRIPARELAVTVHHGPHDDIDLTYGALGRYLAEHALTLAGPVHEAYLAGPRDDPDPAAWRTEIGWPVFRTAPDRTGPAQTGRTSSATG